jgi:hypothetical protein
MCRVAHGVLRHGLGATSVVTFITKRAGLLRSQRSVRLFLVGGYGGGHRPRRLEAFGSYGGDRLCTMLDVNFRETTFYQVG